MALRGVFKIVNKYNGRLYIGFSSTNVERQVSAILRRVERKVSFFHDFEDDFEKMGGYDAFWWVLIEHESEFDKARKLRDNELRKYEFSKVYNRTMSSGAATNKERET